MLNNGFVKRYKSIPIARFECDMEKTNESYLLTALENHREFEVIYIKHGKARVTANGESFTAQEGDILIFSPYMLHSLEIPEGEAFGHICLCFDLSLISNNSLKSALEENNFSFLQHIDFSSPHNKIIKKYILDTDSALFDAKPYWEMVVKGNLSLMFAYLMQSELKGETMQYSKGTKFCLRVIDYLEEHYKEGINSHTVSEALYYDQSYFCRLFKKNFGICFNEYLCLLRLSKAKQLLENKSLSITEIAYETGFSSASYFTKSFRRENGISPKRFRAFYYGL